jgi:hypothetical protein
LLNAGPKKGYSFTWQSIISGLQTFRRGHILRVGNGRRINIWKDHWITGSLSQKIDTPFGQSLLSTVDELIDPATGQWNKITLTFNPLEVQHILQIPISSNLEEDFVAWHKTKSFSFSVRSAYYTKWTHQFGGRVRCQDGRYSESLSCLGNCMETTGTGQDQKKNIGACCMTWFLEWEFYE